MKKSRRPSPVYVSLLIALAGAISFAVAFFFVLLERPSKKEGLPVIRQVKAPSSLPMSGGDAPSRGTPSSPGSTPSPIPRVVPPVVLRTDIPGRRTLPEASSTVAMLSPAPVTPSYVKGRIALIIDDFGNNYESAQGFLKLNIPLTVAVLPGLPYSDRIAVEAKDSGKTVILHLPMEARFRTRLGPGALLVEMDETEIERVVEDDLKTVPGAEGISNHEGSRATGDPRVISCVLSVASKRGLFFVDSLTTPDSVVMETARRSGVRVVQRNVFLDGKDDVEYVRGQLQDLIETAKKRGEAIGIGHVKENTLEVLKDAAPILEKEGVKLVDIKELVR